MIRIILFVIINIIYTSQLLLPFTNSYKLCKNFKKISYDEIVKNKKDIVNYEFSNTNSKFYLKLKNNSEYNYYNSKKNDILGIAHIYQLFTDKMI